VIAKLPGLMSNVDGVVASCLESGAVGFAGINTLPGIIGVDLETFEPRPASAGKSSYGGYSGPSIKPVALAAVAKMVQAGAPHVSGIGGIESWEDAAEFILLGAQTVQLCTAVMWKGYDIIKSLVKGLDDYLARKGIDNISEIAGAAFERLEKGVHDLELQENVVAHVLEECNGCGLCVIACRDGGHQAITMEDDLAEVDSSYCIGCALCKLVCPVDAIALS
jgi:dihydropyrimidine dehydrogenase (NAD+) subunit PreA